MAKQPRPAHDKDTRPTRKAGRAAAPRRPAEGRQTGPDPTPTAPLRSSYVEAVTVYEGAMCSLHERSYARAAEQLRQVLKSYPEEKELAERARLYLTFCERHLAPLDAEPRSVEEQLYAATLALNGGQLDRAIGYLERVVQREPANDKALYMLAASHAERREPNLAIPYLQRAVQANPENRARARTDPDLESLRSESAVVALLKNTAGNADLRRAPSRPRHIR